MVERFMQITRTDEPTAQQMRQEGAGNLSRALQIYAGASDDAPEIKAGLQGRFKVVSNNWDEGVFELELYRRDGQFVGRMDWAWDDVTRWLQEMKRDECMPRTGVGAGSSRDTTRDERVERVEERTPNPLVEVVLCDPCWFYPSSSKRGSEETESWRQATLSS